MAERRKNRAREIVMNGEREMWERTKEGNEGNKVIEREGANVSKELVCIVKAADIGFKKSNKFRLQGSSIIFLFLFEILFLLLSCTRYTKLCKGGKISAWNR